MSISMHTALDMPDPRLVMHVQARETTECLKDSPPVSEKHAIRGCAGYFFAIIVTRRDMCLGQISARCLDNILLLSLAADEA